MYRTLTAATKIAIMRARCNNATYVIVGERGEYSVMSYDEWAVSTFPTYIVAYNSDGIECEDEL